jgi:lipoate-protein ligase A
MTAADVPIRLLDLGTVDPLRSQTIFHAVGYAMTDGSPDTILLVSPNAPYVSIGRHQDVDREVDRAVCAELGFPVIRREVGGGAVYLDGNQLFTQWIFAAEHLPATVEERFTLYCNTLVEAYRALGVEAAYRPVNDIHVNGRKIGGTGAARMDRAEVVVGSLMFDFDVLTMSRVLKVPSEKFRDKVFQTMSEYMTTLRRELGEPPPRSVVVDAYVAACAAALGRAIEPGTLRSDEIELAERLDERFASQEWLEEGGGLRRPGIKIHEGVRVAEGAHKAAGGLIRCMAVVRDDVLEDVAFSGDFTARPADVPERLAEALIGCPVMEDALRARVLGFYDRGRPETPGVTADDWVTAVLQTTSTAVPA